MKYSIHLYLTVVFKLVKLNKPVPVLDKFPGVGHHWGFSPSAAVGQGIGTGTVFGQLQDVLPAIPKTIGGPQANLLTLETVPSNKQDSVKLWLYMHGD